MFSAGISILGNNQAIANRPYARIQSGGSDPGIAHKGHSRIAYKKRSRCFKKDLNAAGFTKQRTPLQLSFPLIQDILRRTF